MPSCHNYKHIEIYLIEFQDTKNIHKTIKRQIHKLVYCLHGKFLHSDHFSVLFELVAGKIVETMILSNKSYLINN